MDTRAWVLYLSIAAVAVAAAVVYYRRREPAGRGRSVLAALRGLAVALVVLLLFDPALPSRGSGRGAPLVLLDASLSMRRSDPAGTTRWEAALDAWSTVDPERVILFGDDVRRSTGGAGAGPDANATRLAPALRAALEMGAGRILVVTDGGVEDAAETRRLLAEAGGRVELRRVGERVAGNLGVEEVEAPRWLEVGEEAAVGVTVARSGETVAESAVVVLRRGERELARATVPVPPEAGLAGTTLRFTPAEAADEPVRLDVTLDGGDAEPADDARSVYVRIADRPAGVALVSFRPDQEPRFLLPVLERALGVPVRGWLALPEGRFIRLGAGVDAGVVDDEATVRRALSDAELRVLHGLGPAAPRWAGEAAESGRLLAFPAGEAESLPFEIPPPRPGDWYPVPELPPSPVAALLAGVEPGDAPPLTSLRAGDPPRGAWSPLDARLGRSGPPRPVVMAGERNGRRAAVALGEGYWRWAFSGDAGRRLYDRLWSAVGGWLMEGAGSVSGDAVEPVQRVVERGAPIRWSAPGGADSLRVLLQPAAPGGEPGDTGAPAPSGGDPVVLDTAVALVDGEAVTPPLAPGRYRYEARVTGAEEEAEGWVGAGELTVESYSREFTRPAVSLAVDAEGGPPDSAGGTAGGGGRPIRTSPWPYVAILGLLCAEWILRRRWGLR